MRSTRSEKLTGPVWLRGERSAVGLADAVVRAIKHGRLAPGERLPGSRTLAAAAGVHRNTVVAAYAELAAQGWVQGSEARGTFVSAAAVPEPASTHALARSARFAVVATESPADRGGPRLLAGGTPDLRLVPRQALARAYRRALTGRKETLDYNDPQGALKLRTALATMLRETRGLACTADDVLVTRGSQQGLALTARALIRPGDIIACEALGYPPAWKIFSREGARLVSVPVDKEGLDIDALSKLMKRRRVRAVYVTPHHQYPTLATLSGPRRQQLLALCHKLRTAIIEDDYDHEFHYAGRPVLPLAADDNRGNTIYVGTLSKILAPGLRLGYVVAPRDVLAAMTTERLIFDRQGDTALELAVAELFEDGEVQRHARRMRRVYAARRDALVRLLRENYPDVTFDVPDGGMSLWVRIRGNADEISRRAVQSGIWLGSGRYFSLDGKPSPHLRIGYAGWDEKTVARAVCEALAQPARA